MTVPDAARHLSILFGETVSEADVLRLALDGHLTLSVFFVNHAKARCGPIIPLENAKTHILPMLEGTTFQTADGQTIGAGDTIYTIDGLLIREGEVLELGPDMVTLDGVWDLMMLGAEQLDVEHRYQLLTDGPVVELTVLDGPLVSREGGTACRIEAYFGDNEYFDRKNLKKPLDHPGNYYPAGTLPSDSVFVVRTSALQELESRISDLDKSPGKSIERRERTTLLVIIAALAKLARIDVTKPSSAAASIESQTALMGARVAARTIENHLNRIPEALESKAED